MGYRSNIEIAQEAKARPINEIAGVLGISEKYIENYGSYKAKIDYRYYNDALKDRPDAKLVLVTAINLALTGEGETTVTTGLADALNRLDRKAMTAMRGPFLGFVFGAKDGVTGGGYVQAVPMEDINLHSISDLHVIGAANNLLVVMLDNHIHQGNTPCIDIKHITLRRAVDMNDRQLRNIVDGLGGKPDSIIRQDGSDITAASEVMAVFCLANGIMDLKERLARIIVAYDLDGQPVIAGQLEAQSAMAALLKDALKPSPAQSLEGIPAFAHGGPSANTAHGCNSVIATKMGYRLADYMVTEAGFGADPGAKKFVDIKYRMSGLCPNAVVLVVTTRTLKYNGGVPKAELSSENLEALNKGISNLLKHIENITTVYYLPTVVAINKLPSDTAAELEPVENKCRELGVNTTLIDVWDRSGAGGEVLIKEVVRLSEGRSTMEFVYDTNLLIKEKIEAVAVRVYGMDEVEFAPRVLKEMRNLESLGYGNLPVCAAKTQYSFTDNIKLLGRPRGFKISIRDITASVGAGFLVALAGDIMKMPGSPKVPAAEKIDVDENGSISGLF